MKNKFLIILSSVVFSAGIFSNAFASSYNNVITIPNIGNFDVTNGNFDWNFNNTFWANNSSSIYLNVMGFNGGNGAFNDITHNNYYLTQSGTFGQNFLLNDFMMGGTAPLTNNTLTLQISNYTQTNYFYVSTFNYSWNGSDFSTINLNSYNTTQDTINNNLTATILSSNLTPAPIQTITTANTLTSGDLTIPSSTAVNMLASVSNFFKDDGLMKIIIIAVALPLFFYFAERIIDFFAKKREEREEKEFWEYMDEEDAKEKKK